MFFFNKTVANEWVQPCRDDQFAGQVIRCPNCNGELMIPETSPSDSVPSDSMQELRETIQSNIDRGEMTITQFMADQEMDGVIDLEGSGDGSTA